MEECIPPLNVTIHWESVLIFKYFVFIAKNLCALLLIYSSGSFSGPFPPAADQPGSTAIHATDPGIIGWADYYIDYVQGEALIDDFKTPEKAIGVAGLSSGGSADYTFDIVSLGRGGSITMVFFPRPIINGDGNDFVVFENAYSDLFLELGWVEVSSNGIDFVRFPAFSLTANPVESFGAVDTTNISGFAGKYLAGYGTPFDLEDIKDSPNIDVNAITHIRIRDVVGDGSNFDDLPSPIGPNPIYDPYETVKSAGFDLDAIGAIHLGDPLVSEVNVPIPKIFILLLGLLCLKIFRSKQFNQK